MLQTIVKHGIDRYLYQYTNNDHEILKQIRRHCRS